MGLEIDRQLDGVSLAGEQLSILPRDVAIAEDDIAISPRIGVDGAGEVAAAWPLRFFLTGNRYVSMPRSWRGAPAIEQERPRPRRKPSAPK